MFENSCISRNDTHNSLDGLVQICKEYQSKLYKLEGDKWDLERGIKIRILEVATQNSLGSQGLLGNKTFQQLKQVLTFFRPCSRCAEANLQRVL